MKISQMAEGLDLKQHVVEGRFFECPRGMWEEDTPLAERFKGRKEFSVRVYFAMADGKTKPVYVERPEAQWEKIDDFNRERYGKSCCSPGSTCAACAA